MVPAPFPPCQSEELASPGRAAGSPLRQEKTLQTPSESNSYMYSDDEIRQRELTQIAYSTLHSPKLGAAPTLFKTRIILIMYD